MSPDACNRVAPFTGQDYNNRYFFVQDGYLCAYGTDCYEEFERDTPAGRFWLTASGFLPTLAPNGAWCCPSTHHFRHDFGRAALERDGIQQTYWFEVRQGTKVVYYESSEDYLEGLAKAMQWIASQQEPAQ